MPGMMDTILNLGLNDQSVEGLDGQDRQRRGSPTTATAASSRCSATSCSSIDKDAFEHEFEAVKKRARRASRHRPRRGRRCARSSRATRRSCSKETGKRVPAGPARAAARRARRRVPVVDEPAREGLPPHLRHSRRHRHRRQRAGDGVRQHGRPLGHRRRLHAQPRDRREGVLRRVPRSTRRARTSWPASARRSRSPSSRR